MAELIGADLGRPEPSIPRRIVCLARGHKKTIFTHYEHGEGSFCRRCGMIWWHLVFTTYKGGFFG